MTDDALGRLIEGNPEQAAIDKKLRAEARAAEAAMAYDFANLHMPEDIRSRAKAWGMEAWAEVLWNNAFQAGYRQALRAEATREG